MENCTNSSQSPMVEELYHLMHDTDPIRLMQLLIDMGAASVQADILTTTDRKQLCQLHHLLGEVARHKYTLQ